MHSIEHLRYLARTGDTDPEWVVPEAADALAGLCGDRNALVMAARMLLGHLGTCGPLWWLCAQALDALDARDAIDKARERFENDPTPMYASLALTEAEAPDATLLVATMVGPTGFIAMHRSRSWPGPDGPDEIATPVWLVAGEGTVVDARIFDAVIGPRQADSAMPLDCVTRVIGPSGLSGVDALGRRLDVPFVPEMLPPRNRVPRS